MSNKIQFIFLVCFLVFFVGTAFGYSSCGTNCYQVDLVSGTFTMEDTKAAIDAAEAASGGTVRLPAGTANFNSGISKTITKDLVITGAGPTQTIINDNIAKNQILSFTVENNALFHIKSMKINTTQTDVNKTEGSMGITGTSMRHMVSDINFNMSSITRSGRGLLLGSRSDPANGGGVIFNNTFYFNGSGAVQAVAVFGGNAYPPGTGKWTDSPDWGSPNKWYIEDNNFVFPQGSKDTSVDAYDNAKFVARYNIFIDNSDGVGWHGFDSSPYSSMESAEVYKNTYIRAGSPHGTNSRGGTALFWGNTYTAGVSTKIDLSYYRSASPIVTKVVNAKGRCNGRSDDELSGTSPYTKILDEQSDATGYHCYQQPGTTGASGFVTSPMMQWGNTTPSGKVKFGYNVNFVFYSRGGNNIKFVPTTSDPYDMTDHVKEERDFLNEDTCSDLIDNDNDGKIDMLDTECINFWDPVNKKAKGYTPAAYPHVLRSGTSTPVCGNSVTEGTETCDRNTRTCTINGSSGTQNCNSTCTGYGTCTATPINGACAATNNFCTTGTPQDITDSVTNYLWNCNGSNGGTNANCSLLISANKVPIVSITAPASEATYTAPATINITATASDSDGTITKVEFFNGATKLGEDATSPYNYTWGNLSAGTYSITARATDNDTATTTSTARSIIVSSLDSNINQGLIAHWKFDEGAGNIANDSSGNVNNGTLNNGTTRTTGKTGTGALSLDGLDDYTTTTSDLIGTGPITSCAWIFPKSIINNKMILNNGKFQLVFLTLNRLAFSSNGTQFAFSGINAIQVNKWQHICTTRDNFGTANIYFDGILSGPADQNSGMPTNGTTNLVIGNRLPSNLSFDGYIDDVRIYGKDLTAQEINKLYNTQLQTRCSNTKTGLQTNQINTFGCPIPIATKFDIRPDFNALDITNLTDFNIGISQYGKISYTDQNISLIKDTSGQEDQLDLDNDITIEKAKVTINTNNLPQLNKPATITLYNITAENPVIKKDGVTCTQCQITSYNKTTGTLTFTVPGF